MRKLIVITMMAIAGTVLLAGGLLTPAFAEKLVMRLGSAYEPAHVQVKAAEVFKKLLEAKSNGEMEVQLFVGGVLGSEEEISESLSLGGVELHAVGGIPMKLYSPKYFFFDSPYVLKDWEHYKRVWASHLGQECREVIAKKGNTIFLGDVYRGVRQFTSNKPVYGPEDVQGMKLRLPQLPVFVKIWKAIGALPVPVPLTELFTSLQMGVADASEGDISQIYAFHLNEVQKYLTFTNHKVQCGWLTANKKWFDGLTQKQQDLIKAAAKESCDWGTRQILDKEVEMVVDMQRKGMTVCIPNANAFREKAKATVEELFKTEWPVATWEEILAM